MVIHRQRTPAVGPEPARARGSKDVAAGEATKDREGDDAEVEREGPVVDVVEVMFHAFPDLLQGVGLAAPAVHLRPPGQPGAQPGGRGPQQQPPPPPPVEPIIEKYIAASGRQAVLDKLQSRIITGTVVNRSNVSMPFTMPTTGCGWARSTPSNPMPKSVVTISRA